ncbi:MAG: hypothetical protein JRI75_10455 [Deltaproteobacteria bacterium]|nr:hypothetical protein [Deltaproteobacteria bacterium]
MATEKDVVLIYFEDQPLAFARIEEISPDIKKDWYHVKLLFLQVPLQIVTWILKDVYINGAEFTMDGKQVRLEKVVSPQEPEIKEKKDQKSEKPGGEKIINLADLKK